MSRPGQAPSNDSTLLEPVSGMCTSRSKHREVGSPKLSVLGAGVFESRWVEIT